MKAFPNGIITNKDGLIVGGQDGMDLRDYFAAKAMAMIPYPLTLNEYHTKHFQEYMVKATKCCYQIADAMMEARNNDH
jgi:hypothetical protein